MKKSSSCPSLFLFAGRRRPADMILSTSNPPGTPLNINAGTTSGSMLVTVVSDNPPMHRAGWKFQLEIMPDGAAGTLTFQDPATGAAPNPPNYFFGTDGLGIEAANGGSTLSANDFYDNPNDPSMTGLQPGTMHLFQHQIHHRGQAHAMLSATAIRPPQLDEFFAIAEAPLRAAEFGELGWTEAEIWG